MPSTTPSGISNRRALLLEQQWLQSVLGASEVEHLYAYLGRAYAFLNAWEKAQDAYEELVAYAMCLFTFWLKSCLNAALSLKARGHKTLILLPPRFQPRHALHGV